MYVREWIYSAVPERTADRYVPGSGSSVQREDAGGNAVAGQLIGYTQTRELLMVCGKQADIDTLLVDMENSDFKYNIQVSPQEPHPGIERLSATITGVRYLTGPALGSYNPSYAQ